MSICLQLGPLSSVCCFHIHYFPPLNIKKSKMGYYNMSSDSCAHLKINSHLGPEKKVLGPSEAPPLCLHGFQPAGVSDQSCWTSSSLSSVTSSVTSSETSAVTTAVTSATASWSSIPRAAGTLHSFLRRPQPTHLPFPPAGANTKFYAFLSFQHD